MEYPARNVATDASAGSPDAHIATAADGVFYWDIGFGTRGDTWQITDSSLVSVAGASTFAFFAAAPMNMELTVLGYGAPAIFVVPGGVTGAVTGSAVDIGGNGALFGAGLGFLWFNAYPAQVFMGDVGSLSLGATLAAVALSIKQEILLFLVGGLFVIEALSVILQVASFKMRGKRVFLMAPLHHHFEEKGWSEPKVTVRFWIVAIMLALLSLSTLKLR